MVALDRFLLISKRAPPKQQPGPSQDRSDAPSSSQVPIALELAEYHLIDLATGFSHGGFKSLAAARQYAREEAIPAWQIFRGNVRIEQHDPREADPIC